MDIEDYLNKLNTSTFHNALIGVEKESIRMLSEKVSQKNHYSELGSALCNKFLTTDFSESQLEFISPPFDSSALTMEFLDALHRFVYENIGSEVLWPFSMPPYLNSDSEISIAHYGVSNLSEFKMLYREGLALRYGKLMQAISGVHFNFSLPVSFFLDLEKKRGIPEKKIRDEMYLSGIRNIFQNNWLLLYLFGSSPIVSSNFKANLSEDFLYRKGSYYLPHATSLRMSNLGYNNVSRSELFISLNDLDTYINQLLSATNTVSKNFSSDIRRNGKQLRQINQNILQIEDEYYSVSRPKSLLQDSSRLTSKLKKGGIDYLELRSIDINPFERSGISSKTLDFLKVFTIYCLFSPSPYIDQTILKNIRKNDLLVSRMGRKNNLFIHNNKNEVKLINWSKEIFEDLYKINQKIGNDDSSISYFEAMLDDPELTPSAKLINEFLNFDGSLEELGVGIADEHKKSLDNKISQDSNSFDEIIKDEALRSLDEQNELESSDSQNLKAFMDSYLNS